MYFNIRSYQTYQTLPPELDGHALSHIYNYTPGDTTAYIRLVYVAKVCFLTTSPNLNLFP